MGGKRSKKKSVHIKPMSTRSSFQSPTQDPLASASPETHEDAPAAMKGGCAKVCRHLERGVNLDKLSGQLGKSKFSLSVCHDCIKDCKADAGKKGKGRSMRKKSLHISASKNQANKWVCVACGHVGCSALPAQSNASSLDQEQTSNGENLNDEGLPKGHAAKHSLLAKHPLALQSGDKLLCWCFMCNMAVDYYHDVDESRQLGSAPLQDAVKFVQEKLAKERGAVKIAEKGVCVVDAGSSVDICMLDPISADGLSSWPLFYEQCSTSQRKRMVKGLINLGNTCFFNSVMQNLLALDLLRNYFCQVAQAAEGPLTSSLRRLFIETSPDESAVKIPIDSSGSESGLKKGGKGRTLWESTGAYNPRSLFGAICAKAPRFRGFQQQDSHELLRCLLEGLNSEEQSSRVADGGKGGVMQVAGGDDNPGSLEERENGSAGKSISPGQAPTLVDTFFGGQLSSTVRCCDCGHSSVVYEPILDLSLQIPSKEGVRKSQARASQGVLSLSRGRPQKESVHNSDARSSKEAQKGDSSITSNVSRQFVSVAKVVSLQGLSFPQGVDDSLLAPCNDISSKVDYSKDAPLGDFDWLDFVGSGTCSAEASIQGSLDKQSSVHNIVGDAQETVHVFQPSISSCDSYLASMEGTGESGGNSSETVPVKMPPSNDSCHGEISGKGSLLNDSFTGGDNEAEQLVHPYDEQDGLLPMASGVLLLPYEPLQKVDAYIGFEAKKLSTAAKNEDDTSFPMRGGNKDTSGSLLDEESSELDGFSQLFVEEESTFENKLGIEVGNDLNSLPVSGDGWFGDCKAFGENDVMAAECQTDLQETILPLSLEGCLTDFTKSELLSGENAWECESCTSRLKEKVFPLASDDEVPQTSSVFSGSKEVLLQTQKENCRPQCKERAEDATLTVNGKLKHGHCTSLLGSQGQNGTLQEPISARDDPCIEVLAACKHQANLEMVKEKNAGGASGKCVTLSTRLNELDSGQLCGSQTFHVGNSCLDPPDNVLSLGYISQTEKYKCESLSTSEVSLVHSGAPLITSKGKEADSFSRKPNRKAFRGKTLNLKIQSENQLSVKRDAIKRLLISKAPPVLTIHLKRFAQDLRGRLNKLSGHVAFPEVLDLRPFLDPKYLDLDNCIYRLVGIVEHGGTMRGGHYIAYVRGPPMEESNGQVGNGTKDCWYCISDSSVHKSTLQTVLSSEAYLLFYEKCKFNKS